jgi:hypothetical protein
MSRPKKAVVDYFPHYVNHGKTMFTLENRYGNDGYAFWFKTLELLGSSENHFIDCNNPIQWEFMLAKTRLTEETAKEILDLLAKIDAIDQDLWSKKIIRSQNFIDNLSTVYSRREVSVVEKSELMGLMPAETPLTENHVNINPQSQVKESKGKKSNLLRESDFEVWYKTYPVKKSKQKALEHWNKYAKSGALPELEILLAAVKNQAAERIRKKQAGQFCPEWKHPDTWLNQKCWEDETGDSQSDIEARLTDSGYDRVTGKYMTENGEPRVCL